MLIKITSHNKVIDLQVASRHFNEREIFLQWIEMVENGQEFVQDPNCLNAIVAKVTTSSEYDAFVEMTEAQRFALYATFFKNYYDNLAVAASAPVVIEIE